MEEVLQSSWVLEPLIKHKGGYGSSLVAAEVSSILKVQVSWDKQQEQKEQESGVIQTLEWYRGQNGKVTQSCGGSVMIICVHWILKKKKLWYWSYLRDSKTLTCYTCVLPVLEKCWIKPHKEIILLHWTKQKGVRDLKNTLTTDMKMQSLEISQLALVFFRSTISSCCL